MGVLRFLLAVCVVVGHTQFFMGNGFIGGPIAVEIFFIISGFYMSLILNEKYTGSGSYKLFITNRFLKIYPSYFFVLLLTIVISLVYFKYTSHALYLQPYISNIQSMPIPATIILILSNIIIFGQDIVMFLGVNIPSGTIEFVSNFRNTNPPLFTFLLIPQAWSISIELMFYVIAPMLVRRSAIFITSMIIGGLLFKYFFIINEMGLSWDPWTYRFFPSEIAYFLIGSLSYKINCAIKKNYTPLVKLISLMLFVTIIGMIIEYRMYVSDYSYIYLMIASFISIPFIFNLTKKSSIDRYIGELSYPIYLIHFLVRATLSEYIDSYNLSAYKAEIITFVSILAAIAIVHIVIKPIDRYRQNRMVR